jgi:hypothetical protein
MKRNLLEQALDKVMARDEAERREKNMEDEIRRRKDSLRNTRYVRITK